MKTGRAMRLLRILAGIVLAAVYLMPIYVLVVNSFKTQKGIYFDVLSFPEEQFFTMGNYPEAFEKLDFAQALFNSVAISVTATALIIIVSSMAAWALVRCRGRRSNGIFYTFAAAMLLPFQCVMLPLVSLMGKLGLLNPVGLVFMYVGFGTSLSIILYHGFIKNIPVELEEAATIDGCGPFRLFWVIVFPLLRTVTVTVGILNIMWIYNDFLLPMLTINRPGWQTLPLRTYLFFGQFSKRWDLATAGLILSMIPIVVFYLAAQKYIVRGVTDGAIK